MAFAYELLGKRALPPDIKDMPGRSFAVRPDWSREWMILRPTNRPRGEADRGHEFVAVGNRRWCIGCDLFQRKPWAGSPFPEPKWYCPQSTPHANPDRERHK